MQEEEEVIEATPAQIRQMQTAEQEIQRRQYIEYEEKTTNEPDNQIALDKSLLKVEAKLSTKKEMIPNIVKMPDGSLRAKMVENETDWPEIFTEDLIKGNYNDNEIESIWGNALNVSYLKFLGESRKLNLRPAAEFFKVNEHLFINPSRGKNMAAALLTKTDKHVSDGFVKHFYQEQTEKKKKRWGFM